MPSAKRARKAIKEIEAEFPRKPLDFSKITEERDFMMRCFEGKRCYRAK